MPAGPMVHKLQVVRVIVRPDRREEYLLRWEQYRWRAEELGARARLLEDEVLPGRFLEVTEFEAGPGMEAALRDAAALAGLPSACVRRAGEGEQYRERHVGPAAAAGGREHAVDEETESG